MKVIGLSGWKQSGKDTLAAYVIEKYGAQRVSFADPLKDMVAKEYSIPRDSLDLPELKEKPILSMPVEPKDKFTQMITDFMRGEFRDQNGKRYGEGSISSRLYWTPRALAILEGSVKRSVSSDFWVQKAIQDIEQAGKMVVVSDLRYRSEIQQMREAFGKNLVTIRIERFDSSPSQDPSERDLDHAEFDHRLSNRGTKEEAFAALDAIINEKSSMP